MDKKIKILWYKKCIVKRKFTKNEIWFFKRFLVFEEFWFLEKKNNQQRNKFQNENIEYIRANYGAYKNEM